MNGMAKRDRESALQRLEEQARQNPQREFMGMLADLLEFGDAEDFEIQDIVFDSKGPLGGHSQQIIGVFTDSKDRHHGVILNCYVGEPDIHLDDNGNVHR